MSRPKVKAIPKSRVKAAPKPKGTDARVGRGISGSALLFATDVGVKVTLPGSVW